MTADEFVRLVGPHLAHFTAAANSPSIRAHGLLRPVTLAARAEVDPDTLVLRDAPVTLAFENGRATLNHQRPLRAGRGVDFLDGMTIGAWSAALDTRLFFWPGRGNAAFAGSVAARGGIAKLLLDSRAVFAAFAPFIDLAPINTGDATRRPTRRGTWIYVPVTASVEAFRTARKAHGGAGKDRVKEVSLRCDIPPESIASAAVVTGAGLNFARIGA